MSSSSSVLKLAARLSRFRPLAASALLYGSACTSVGSNTSATCSEYLSCLSTASPTELPAGLQAYGHDGTCWATLGMDGCSRSCEQALTQLKQRPFIENCVYEAPPDLAPPDLAPAPPDLNWDAGSIAYWDFGIKTMYFGGTRLDPALAGEDMSGQWRCKRDDNNPSPTDPAVLRALEPNDLPETAISLSNPLPVDPPATYMGSPYEICPDRSSPQRPDIDVFRFKLSAPADVKIEAIYQVAYGDLDLALFSAPVAGAKPARIAADLTARDNACVAAHLLPAGTYYAVVRGTPFAETPMDYSLNRYRFKAATYSAGSSDCP